MKALSDSPFRSREIDLARKLVSFQAQTNQAIESVEAFNARDLVPVGLEVAEMAQRGEMRDRVELVVADVETLEVVEVLEGSETREAIRSDEKSSQCRRNSSEVRDFVVAPVNGDRGQSIGL